MTTAEPMRTALRPAAPGAKLKILYIQPGTRLFAGIERVIDSVCTELVNQYGTEFDVDVLYTSSHQNFPADARKYNRILREAPTPLSRIFTYRRLIQRGNYDLVVVPQIEPMAFCWLACIGLNCRFALHLHGNPAHERTRLKARIMFFIAEACVLRRIPYIFGTSPAQIDAFKDRYELKAEMRWLPNPVRSFGALQRRGEEPARPTTFVNVGRFDHQKGQDILIGAFAKLYRRQPNVRLKLVGHGGDEPALRAQIERLKLNAVVDIEYHPTDPHAALAASDIYVSTSRWEGWSLVICEALRFGLPVIAVDCDFGPRDILVDTRLGRLVPPRDEDALVDAMSAYHDNLHHERAFSRYRQDYVDRFSLENVVHLHADALRSAARSEQGAGRPACR
ncbi:glycosyltransferase [Ancylobacter sp. A5.8]|uniref:glycosyltransferase n=1 Tax=Ancylobacter gelatini TaxID=2919920 RepID=UPI001F4E4F4F|nr:glycosyltransferase [Ancylobacter gelatini]MCJ8145238.1 glycosyltransferase [Ancylobacter gelatini]